MKPWLHAVAILLALVGVSRADDKPQSFPDQVPTKLLIWVGGFDGNCYSIELKDGFVIYKKTSGHANALTQITSLRPDKKAWSTFIKEINDAKLCHWVNSYPNPGVSDGTQWQVDLEINGVKFQSKGNNNYPTDGDEAKPTGTPNGSPAFDRLCAAVSHLVGQEFK